MSDPREPFGEIEDFRSVFRFVEAVSDAGPLDGWAFESNMAGAVCYVRPDERLSVYCTPDWEGEIGTIVICVVDDQGTVHETDSIDWPIGPGRTIASYRALVAPVLAKHATTEIPV